MNKYIFPYLIWACIFGCFAVPATYSQVHAAPIFGDSMVLQQQIPIPVWGNSAPREMISVSLHKQSQQTLSDDQGKWEVILKPEKAGGPFILLIEGENTLLFKNVLIGEVWLCSGQSNMAFPLSQDFAGKEELATMDFSQIRLFDQKGSAYPSRVEFSAEQLDNLRKGNYYLPTKWRSCSPATAKDFSAVAYYFGKSLHEQFHVPIGLINNAIGGSSTESWISKEALDSHPQLRYLVNVPAGKTWLDLEGLHPFLIARGAYNLRAWIREGQPYRDHPFKPTYLYETGIQPLIPFALRGVIWYQGESNSTNPELHKHLFPLLIESWRKDWGQGDFPFLFVQLPGMGTSKGYQAEKWPEFRASQEAALSLPNTGMAVTIDVGNPTDVHPKDKKTVGERLARIAKAQVYGLDIIHSGPIVDGFEVVDRILTITWLHASGGLKTADGETPKGLVLRGYVYGGQEEQLIAVRDAWIEGHELRIPFPEGFVPYELKYAWAPFPICNLINGDGLPAAPFKLNLIEKK